MSAIFTLILILVINLGVIVLHAYAAIVTFGWGFYLCMLLALLVSWLSVMSLFHVRVGTYRARVIKE